MRGENSYHVSNHSFAKMVLRLQNGYFSAQCESIPAQCEAHAPQKQTLHHSSASYKHAEAV